MKRMGKGKDEKGREGEKGKGWKRGKMKRMGNVKDEKGGKGRGKMKKVGKVKDVM
jgi:hypothetical protein